MKTKTRVFLIQNGRTKEIKPIKKYVEPEPEPEPDEPLPFKYDSELFFVRSMVGVS